MRKHGDVSHASFMKGEGSLGLVPMQFYEHTS
jgi:hypothetical protein